MKPITSSSDIAKVIEKYRKRLGIDSVYIIHPYIVVVGKRKNKHMIGTDAYIQVDETHPIASMYISSDAIKRFAASPRCMVRLIVHELYHLIIGEAFKAIKKSYDYDKDGMIEESLVTRLARAVVPLSPQMEKLYDAQEVSK